MTVKVGRLSSNEDWFNPFSTDPSQYDEWGNLHFISADTWQARRLSYDVRVVCSNDYSSLIGRAEAKLDEADEMEPFLNSRAKGMLGGRSA